MYYYIRSEPQLWTVGCEVQHKWRPESDHGSREEAARRVAFLNGDCTSEIERLRARVAELEQENARLQASLDDCESFSSPNWNNVD